MSNFKDDELITLHHTYPHPIVLDYAFLSNSCIRFLIQEPNADIRSFLPNNISGNYYVVWQQYNLLCEMMNKYLNEKPNIVKYNYDFISLLKETLDVVENLLGCAAGSMVELKYHTIELQKELEKSYQRELDTSKTCAEIIKKTNAFA